MIAFLAHRARVIRAALEYANAAHAYERASREARRLGLDHNDTPCRSCALTKPLEIKEYAARRALLSVMGNKS